MGRRPHPLLLRPRGALVRPPGSRLAALRAPLRGQRARRLFLLACAGALVRRRGVHRARHYVRGVGGKPWARVLAWRDEPMRCGWGQMKRAAYLRAAFTESELADEVQGARSACGGIYARARRALGARLDAAACCESMGFHAPQGQYGGDLVHVF